MKIFDKRILVLVITILLCFLMGEAIIRAYLNQKIIYDIEMTRYSLIAKQDAENPLIGHIHKPNISVRLMDAMVNINSDGLRDKEYPLAKGNEYRIVFLGDSLTFGWGVEEEDIFATILEQGLNKAYPTEVINFGTGNYNVEQEVNLFIEKGLKYKPDKVVLFYFINDAEKTPVKSKLWFLGYSRLVSFYWSRIHNAFSNLFDSKTFHEYYSELYQDDQIGWINAKKALLELKDICSSKNIEFQVVLLPELHDVKNQPFKEQYGLVSSLLRDNNISHLDLSPHFSNYTNSMELWVSLDDAHPNKLAHKMIADHALDFISQKRHGGNLD